MIFSHKRVPQNQEVRPGIRYLRRGGAAIPTRLPAVEGVLLAARLRGLPSGLYAVDGHEVLWNGKGIPRSKSRGTSPTGYPTM